jgi:hypothetical protein
MERFEVSQKILMPDVVQRGSCFLDTHGRWPIDTLYCIVPRPGSCFDIRYLLALLNSPILTWFLKQTGTALRGGYFRMKTAYVNPFPIRPINFSDPADKVRHDRMVTLVDAMLELHKRLAEARSDADRALIQRQIDATDREIDKLVYELYGLTADEIRIVEEGRP